MGWSGHVQAEGEGSPLTRDAPEYDLESIQLRRVASTEDVSEFKQWLGERREFLAVDVETSGLLVGWDFIRLAQFGDGRMGWAFDYRDWRGVVAEAIARYDRPVVCHNLLFDSKMLKADGISLRQNLSHCSMVMAHLADPAAAMGLKSAASRYIDRRARIGAKLLDEAFARGGWTWETIPTTVPAYWQYSAFDTCLSALLAERLYPDVRKGPYELEVATINVLREAEIAGMRVDEGYRLLAEAKLAGEVAELEVALDRVAPDVNPGSDQQVIKALHALGAEWHVYTEHGNLSVDKDVLKWLGKHEGAAFAEMATLLGQWRSKERLLNSYIRKFAPVGQGINAKGVAVGLAVNGALHASTKPVAARTGRMSITQPPLQTLPRGRVVRDAIVPRDGCVFVMSDFSGMEMRVLASMAQEPEMLAAYGRGEDLHDFVASKLYGEDFTKPQRTVCKNAGFAKVYGAGVEKFAVTAEIDVETARTFLEQYDGMFPGVRTYMERVVGDVIQSAGGRRRGYGHVTLVDGRWLPVEADKAYKGVNFRIQGSCAVVLKKKIVELDAIGLGHYFRLPVHDELLFEVPVEEAADVRDAVEEVMPERDLFPGVTLEVESDIVERWGSHYRDDFEKYIETEDAEWLRTL